jgi:hypothetical protein
MYCYHWTFCPLARKFVLHGRVFASHISLEIKDILLNLAWHAF